MLRGKLGWTQEKALEKYVLTVEQLDGWGEGEKGSPLPWTWGLYL